MAIGLKERATVVGYVPKRLKERMERIQQLQPRESLSKQVEEALDKWLPKKEAQLRELESMLPSQDSPSEVGH